MKQLHLFSRDILDIKIDNEIYQIRDFTNTVSIDNVLKKYDEFIKTIQVDEDEKIENISFKLYGTTDYWDMLIILNGMKSMIELPVNYDKVVERAKNKFNKWLKIFSKLKTQEQKDQKYEEFLNLEIDLNEKYRNLKYIDRNMISKFQLDIRNYKKDIER